MEEGATPGIDVDRQWPLRIGGDQVTVTDTYDIVDPNTTRLVGRAPEATVEHVRDAVAAAKAALPAWRARSMADRCDHLARAADALEAVCGEWVDLVQAETGATARVARSMQVGAPFLDRFRYYARPRDLDVALPPVPAAASALAPASLIGGTVVHQPVGVVGCITPYNFPLVNVAGKVAPALAMGNTVVIKPAPQDPLAILELCGVLDAVLPAGVVNVVTGSGPELGAALVESPDVAMVSFTGSTAVGVQILAQGAATMTRTLLELGGKGPLVMTEDCDVGAAVRGIASVWGFHSGQICTAPTRVICHRDRYDETIAALEAAAPFLTLGDATADETVVGPVITEVHRDRVEAFVRAGVDEGARLVLGGERPDRPGWFVAPTLLADCDPGMRVAREEAFGPVVVAMAHDGDDHAVELANDSDYGLFGYVYAGTTTRAYDIATRLETGNVALNSVAQHPSAPFGGFKMSGLGRDRGAWGLRAYAEVQAVNWSA